VWGSSKHEPAFEYGCSRGASSRGRPTGGGNRPAASRAFDQLLRQHDEVRGYLDCIAHGSAAEGVIGAVVDYGLRVWDLAATRLLVEEAGGMNRCTYRAAGRQPAMCGIVCGKPSVVWWLVQRYFGSTARLGRPTSRRNSRDFRISSR